MPKRISKFKIDYPEEKRPESSLNESASQRHRKLEKFSKKLKKK